jgi:hypothetical protein
MTVKSIHKRALNPLEMEGWKKQFIASEPRLSEAVQLYEESGFEVILESLPDNEEFQTTTESNSEGECRVCFSGTKDQYKVIYTRRKSLEKSR